jgi:hypothetical protein
VPSFLAGPCEDAKDCRDDARGPATGYLPWLGYFDLLQKADVFLHYDDVQSGIDFGFAGSKWCWLDIEYASSKLHPFSVVNSSLGMLVEC